MEQPTDEILMQRVADGDLDAMKPLFESYNKWLYNFFLQMGQDRDAAADLVQATFYKAIKYRKSYKDGKFSSWIFKIGRNTCADHFKERKKIRQREGVPLEQVVDREDQLVLDNTQEMERLNCAMQKLAVADRELLVMSRYQGMKYAQIAEALSSTEPAIKVKMHRAIKKLRKLYFQAIEP